MFFKGKNRLMKYNKEFTKIETETKTARCSLLREPHSKSADDPAARDIVPLLNNIY